MATSQRQDKGRHGEEIAARFLALGGATVLQRNAHHAGVEVDLVARDGDCLVLAEVKLRTGQAVGARDAIGAHQEQRLLRAARAFLAANAWAAAVRVDVIAIDLDLGAGSMRLEHVRGALPRG
jgi:putative endonuclease